MKTQIINTDWFLGLDPPEGSVTFKGKNGGLIDAFSYGENFTIGEIIDIALSSISADVDLKYILSENKEKQILLVRSNNDWEYEGYGRIISIDPVIIDFGEFELDTGSWTDDKGIIGEYVYWKINRLDLNRK
ncbi:MAG: hypothetical protein JXB49_20280 [Bacteroidales bacterium]|nr:hypothetical protein [Bacteroidales bacterium]